MEAPSPRTGKVLLAERGAAGVGGLNVRNERGARDVGREILDRTAGRGHGHDRGRRGGLSYGGGAGEAVNLDPTTIVRVRQEVRSGGDGNDAEESEPRRQDRAHDQHLLGTIAFRLPEAQGKMQLWPLADEGFRAG
jgi:hypothetical protein